VLQVAIRAYNTLTRKKEELIPRDNEKIAIYICGPTVYNFIHIGNARCYVAFDAIVRYLKFGGYKVTYVRNLTDVDDKIIKRAQEEKTTSSKIAEKYTKAFWEDMEALGCLKPNKEPKATEEIPEMLKIIEGLIKKGFAYVVDGDVFYEVTKFEDYGKLSHRTLDEMRAGERVEVDPRKHHPMDFALWKKAKPGEPSWPSSWGEGRPGWHIECSAMSLRYLGMSFDIHGGGQDLVFPHHENEIAQSEAYAGTKPFVRYWLHNGFVTIKAEKMAKSVGNVILIRDLRDEFKGREIQLRNALRMLFLSTHYRSPIDFSPDHLGEAKRKVSGLLDLFWRLDNLLEKAKFSQVEEASEDEKLFKEKISEAEDKFKQAMNDDFNTPGAIAALFELERDTNIFIDKHEGAFSPFGKSLLEEARKTISNLGENVLGLALSDALAIKKGLKIRLTEEISVIEHRGVEIKRDLLVLATEFIDQNIDDSTSENDVVSLLIDKREEARKEKDFQTADKIRAGLTEIGVIIEDTPHGARWKWR
jgi:cysteinyl-tRNA synthetase